MLKQNQDVRVRGWRRLLLLSQRQAAIALGMSLKAFQELERGADFETGLPRRLDTRTELALLYLLAREKGAISPQMHASLISQLNENGRKRAVVSPRPNKRSSTGGSDAV